MSTLLRNHALWAAPLLAVVGFLSYWGFFVRWPQTRDIPWVNLIVLAVALVWSARAAARAWSGGVLRKLAGTLGVVISGGLTALLVFYCFVLSYSLPSAEGSIELGAQVPGILLVDQQGLSVDLASASQDPLVLVFYRGHW